MSPSRAPAAVPIDRYQHLPRKGISMSKLRNVVMWTVTVLVTIGGAGVKF